MAFCKKCTTVIGSAPCYNCGCEKDPVGRIEVPERVDLPGISDAWEDRILNTRIEDREKVRKLFQ